MFKYIRTGSAKRRSVLPHSHHEQPNMSNLITVSSAEATRRKTPRKSHVNGPLEGPKNVRFQYNLHEDSVPTKTKRPRHRSGVQDGGPHYRLRPQNQAEIAHEDLKKLKFQLPHVFDTSLASEKSATNIRRLFAYLLQNIQQGGMESIPKNHPIYLYSKKYRKKLLKRLKKSDKLNKDRSVETSSTSLYQISDRFDDALDANELRTCANSISDLQTTSYASSIDNLFQDANHLRNNTPIPPDDDDIAKYFVSFLQDSSMAEQFQELETQTEAAAASIQVQLDQLDPSEVPDQIMRTTTGTGFHTYPNNQTIKLDSIQIQLPIPNPEPQLHSPEVSLKQHSSSTFKLLPINTNIPSESPQEIPDKITPEITLLDTPVQNMNSTAHHPVKPRLDQPKKRKNKRQRLSRVKAQTNSSREKVISLAKRRKVHELNNSKSADQLNLRCSLPTASLSLCRLRKSDSNQEILKSSWQPHDGLEVILEPKSHLLRDEQEQRQYDPTQKALVEQCYWVMNCFNMCCPRPFICPPMCCSPCPPQGQQQQQQQCRWSFECTPSNHLTGCGNNNGNNNGNCCNTRNGGNNCNSNGNNCNNNGNNCNNNGNNYNNNSNNCSNGKSNPYQSSQRSNCGEMNLCNPRKFPLLSPSHLSPPKFCPRSPSITPPRRQSGGFGSSPTPSDASSPRGSYLSDYSSFNPIPPRLPPKPMDRYPAPPQSSSYCPMPPQSVGIPVPYPVPCYAPAPPPCFMPPFFFPFCPQPTPAAAPATRSGHRSSCDVNRSTGKGFPSPSGTGFPSHSGGGFTGHSSPGFLSSPGFPGHSAGGFSSHTGGGMCCPTPIAFCCPFNPSQAPGNMAGLPKENSCEMGKACKRAKRRAKRRNGKRSSCCCCCK